MLIGGIVRVSFCNTIGEKKPGDAEWDGFVKFEDNSTKRRPENENDLWNKHKNLFDLQHLNLSDSPHATTGEQPSSPTATKHLIFRNLRDHDCLYQMHSLH